jgi:hypothetical protein
MSQNIFNLLRLGDSSPEPSFDTRSSGSSTDSSEDVAGPAPRARGREGVDALGFGVSPWHSDGPGKRNADANKGELSAGNAHKKGSTQMESSSNANKHKSIADDATYPPDVRTMSATNHRRDAVSGKEAEQLLHAALAASVSALPGTSPSPNAALTPHAAIREAATRTKHHIRHASSTTDFAYSPDRPAHRGSIETPDAHIPERRRPGLMNTRFSFPSAKQAQGVGDGTQSISRTSEQFDSTQPTAVNTPRAPSMSQPATNAWAELRDVVSAAQTGVTLKLSVYVSAPLLEDRLEGSSGQDNNRWISEAIAEGGKITVVKLEQQHAEAIRMQRSNSPDTIPVPLTWLRWLGRKLHAAFVQPVLYTFDIVITTARVALCIAAFCTLIAFIMFMIHPISSALEYIFPMKMKQSFAARDAPASPFATPRTASKTCVPLSVLQQLSRVAMVLASVFVIALWF